MSRFQFVADNSAAYPVKRLCQLLEVGRSSNHLEQRDTPGARTAPKIHSVRIWRRKAPWDGPA